MTGDERRRINRLLDRLFPICRSITGPGFRESLDIFREHVPLKRETVESGTQVFDWEIPPEWRIRDAYIVGPDGERYAEFGEHNLHVVNYSSPVDRRLTREELDEHLYSLEDRPDVIPYVTTYYERNWGFCLRHETRESLPDGEYHAHIDSEFVDGGLTYGHTTLEGESDAEVLLSTYLCHPSMGNNELSGPLTMALLYDRIREWDRRRFTYRFVVVPETIGSITYLHEHGDHLKEQLVGGLVLTCLGGPRETISYKRSRAGDTVLDRTVGHLRETGELATRERSYAEILGSDERQYCSPGFDLPVGQVARTVYEQYEEYHTSADDRAFIDVEQILESATAVERILKSLEYAGYFRNLEPYGEPMLSKRDLYPTVNNYLGDESTADFLDGRFEVITVDEETFFIRLLRILHYSDGEHPMLDIAEMCGCSIDELAPFVDLLEDNELLCHSARDR